MLLALVLLGVVGACAGLAFLSEESLGNLRAKASEAKRWVLLKLDSLGQPPGIDSDCDCDLEAGFGEAREALVDNGKRVLAGQLSKPIRPIRRSVHRGQGGGAISSSTHVTTSPPSEYGGGLYDRAPDKIPHELHSNSQQQQQQVQEQEQQPLLPRPPVSTTAMSLGGGRPPDGESRAPLPHHSHRRGMSFDVNAAASVDTRRQQQQQHPTETRSARGSLTLTPSAYPDAANGGGDLPANLVTAFGGGDTVEQQIPVYIPLQKKGSMSKATHRRSSSRGADGFVLGVGGGGGGGGGAIGSSASAGRSPSPPGSSPFRCARSPVKVLPPVPAFAGPGAGSGSDFPAAPPPPPPPLPPSWDVGQDPSGGGAAAVGGRGVGYCEGGYREQGPGRSPHQYGGSEAVISLVPFAPDRQSVAPTTPKQGQQRQQQEAPSGRGSSFFAGPSPDGDNSFSHIDYVANYVADSMAGGGEAGIKPPPGGSSFWDGSGSGGGGSDAYDKQRDERAPISVLPASPAWSADDDVNRGTGVRRRVSPRAAGGAHCGGGGMSPRAGGGMSPRAGGALSPRAGGVMSPRAVGGGFSPRAAAGGGGRSPRRASAGWAQPMVSPRRRDHGGSARGGGGGRGGGNHHELRPLALAFSEEGGAGPATAAAAVAPASPPRHQGRSGLRIDVGDAEDLSRAIVGATGGAGGAGTGAGVPPSSPMSNALATAETPLAGGRGAGAGRRKAAAVASTAVAGVVAGEAAAAAAAAVVTESTVRQIGLRCSSPLYDRGRNMLGSVGGDGRDGDGQGAPPLPPTEKRGGGVSGHVGSGGVSGSEQERFAGRDSRWKEARATDGPAPPPALVEETTLGRVADEPRASSAQQGGGRQQHRATEENARQGRDLSSSEAFAASLDLPFDQLELNELVGGGGFGQVYQGVWRGTPVAVKVLVPVAQRDLDEELAADFRAEVLMLAALRHPNVCLFMGACMVPPNRAIVTELLTRGSLWEALRAGRVPAELASASAGSRQRSSDGGGPDEPLTFLTPQDCWPWSVVVKVAEGIACGMWYLHQHEPFPILHRDLKSANLLLDECFNVKICDFGLARLKAFTTSAAMTGNCGTVQWMAPEVLASEKYAEPADVYSFAIVCWELLSRACPYDGMSQIQVAVAVLNDGLRPEIPEWCPREFASLIKNGWEQDPNKRPSFGDVLEFLRKSPSQTCF